MKIALSHAHSPAAQGAAYRSWFHARALAEWGRSKAVNEFVKEILNGSDIEVDLVDPDYPGDSYRDHLRRSVTEINNLKPKIAIETHFNASPEPRAHGYEVLYFAHSDQSRKLAFQIFEAMRDMWLTPRGIVPRDDIYFLERTTCPSVIVEAGYLSNPRDREYIKSNDFIEILARRISKGILSYKEIEAHEKENCS